MIRHEHSHQPRPNDEWPGWMYSPDGESAIFECAEDVPEGWTQKLGEGFTPFVPTASVPLDADMLRDELIAKGIEIDYTWSAAHMQKVLEG